VQGVLLGLGVELKETDLYSSSDGIWKACPCPGIIIRGFGANFVRPHVDLSTEAESLLDYLRDCGYYLTQRGFSWVIVPARMHEYDGMFQQDVRHPGCVQELMDSGLVTPALGYSNVWEVNPLLETQLEG